MTTEKRLLVAAALSVAVLLLWSKLFPGPEPPSPARPLPAATAAPAASQGSPPSSVEAPIEPTAALAETRTTLENGSLRAVFSNRGGVLTSIVLLKYRDAEGRPLELVRTLPPEAPKPFSLDFGPRVDLTQRISNALFVAEKPSGTSVRLRYADGSVSVTKDFSLGPDYLCEGKVGVVGPAYGILVGPGLRNTTEQERSSSYVQPPTAIASVGGSIERMRAEKAEKVAAEAKKAGHEGFAEWTVASGSFAGLEDNYFLTVLLPRRGAAAWIIPYAHRDAAGRPLVEVAVALAGQGETAFKAYFGPKDLDVLGRQGLGLERTVDFGWVVFDVVARPLLWLLRKTYAVVGNYGWSILIVTFFIRILIFPLVHKSYASMKKMQKLAPKMNAIRDRYKGKTTIENRNKMNQELMALYQAEGYNPMSGCFPILLQMPVFIGFYNVLRSAIELRQAPWIFWVKDLSAVDGTYVLVILMVVTMYIQQALTPTTADPVQKRIFMALPFVWGFFLRAMPSGLVLYWLFSNVLTILQQILINRMGAKDEPEPSKGARSKKVRAERVAS